MNFGNGVQKLQKEYLDYIVVVKNGVFYNVIGKDAIYLEKISANVEILKKQ